MKNQITYTRFIFSVAIILLIIVAILVWTLINNLTVNPRDIATSPTPTPVKQGNSLQEITPTVAFPTPFPTPTNTQIPLDPVIKEKIAAQMPQKTELYDIEYLQTSDSFVITIKKSPYNTNKSIAENWLQQQGVTNLKSLNILYNRRLLVQ